MSGKSGKEMRVEVGERAPDFVLPNECGERWCLSDQTGHVTALLFYPKNETLVCTKQLCSVRDHWSDYLETKATVVGISPGTSADHSEFASKYKLPLPLLADADRNITGIFGRHSWMPISMTRAIVVVDAKGFVRSKKVMFRAFRPTDYTVIQSIYAARTDALHDRFEEIISRHRQKM